MMHFDLLLERILCSVCASLVEGLAQIEGSIGQRSVVARAYLYYDAWCSWRPRRPAPAAVRAADICSIHHHHMASSNLSSDAAASASRPAAASSKPKGECSIAQKAILH